MGMPSCRQRGYCDAADDALIQAMRESCGRLRQQRIFYNRGQHSSHVL